MFYALLLAVIIYLVLYILELKKTVHFLNILLGHYINESYKGQDDAKSTVPKA